MIDDKVFIDIIHQTNNSPLRKFESLSQARSFLNFSIGQPHFKVPQPILEAIAKSIKDGCSKYSSPLGILPLREKIAERYHKEFQHPIDVDNVIIGSGVSNLINLLMMVIVKPNDAVLLIEPYYFAYKNLLAMYKADMITLNENFSYDDLVKIKKNVKMIVFASPSNPTGYIMKREQIDMLARYADHVGAILVSDEIYREFDYESSFVSAGSIYPNAVVLMGFSKSHAMTGLRLGVAIGPKEIIERMAVVQTNTMICATVPVQWGGVAALDVNIRDHVLLYKANMERFIAVMRNKVRFKRPEGGFYIFFESDDEEDVFLDKALKTANMLLTQGNIFTNSKKYIRLSFCVSEEEAILGANAMKILLS